MKFKIGGGLDKGGVGWRVLWERGLWICGGFWVSWYLMFERS